MVTIMSAKKNQVIYLFIFLNFAFKIKSAKILGIFPMVGGSHFRMSSSLMRGLAESGNEVTIICPQEDNEPVKNGSYRSIALEGFAESLKNGLEKVSLIDLEDFNSFRQEAIFQDLMLEHANLLVKVPAVQNLIKSKETFDVVIIEQFSNDGLKVFAHIFKGHLIVFCPIGPYNFVNRLVANPTMISYNPQVVSSFSRPISFADRVYNTLLYTYEEILNNFIFLPRHNEFIKKHFPGAPSIYDLTKNVSLVLLNSHESIWQSLPLVPNAIPIGGYHINPPKRLPKDIQRYLDGAKEGVIYFSLGTNLKIGDMEESKQKMFVNVFSKIKERVLCKLDKDIPGLPKNVKSSKWLPQMDILAHPNVKLFISHGGLLSMAETIYNGVPILVIPVFGDQATNGNTAVKAGYGLSINYHDADFSEEKIIANLKELLNNPKYKESAIRHSKIYHDRPMKPMELANYWINFVIRHKGAPHLRVDGLYLPWYQYLLIDVMGFFIIVFIVLVLFVLFILKAIFAINVNKDNKVKKI